MGPEIIARNLRLLRKELKMTLKEMASAVNYSQSFLNDIEHQRSHPSLNTIFTISKKLGIRPVYFFSEPGEDGMVISESDMIQRIAYLSKGREILEQLKDIDKLDEGERQEILNHIIYIKTMKK